MKFGLVIVSLLLLLTGCGSDQNAPDPMVLVQNERAFAADVADVGMRDGFLANIADDGVLFIPEAVNGKEHYEAQERRPGLMSRLPTYAEISSGGDMGWTTGPWEWRTDPMDELPRASGHYITIWVRQPDSTWKFVFDMGTAHHAHQAPTPTLSTRVLSPAAGGGDLTIEQYRIELVQLERRFSSASEAEGMVSAYVARMANDIRFYRMGEYPIQGVSDVTTELSRIEGVMTWEVRHADVSQNGDLAYTFGVSRIDNAGAVGRFSYGRIWRRDEDGIWELALDIHIPLLPESIPIEEEIGG